MGKAMYNFGKNAKEKARQLKQMEKASKRLAAKQSKANMKSSAPSTDSEKVEPSQVADIANGVE